ncbi:MAG TPA: hypothetical protein VKX49_03235 [Bryobacteraceae bacterium]|nr:hypothetical protein [Bryobacteraceae bacterium]
MGADRYRRTRKDELAQVTAILDRAANEKMLREHLEVEAMIFDMPGGDTSNPAEKFLTDQKALEAKRQEFTKEL